MILRRGAARQESPRAIQRTIGDLAFRAWISDGPPGAGNPTYVLVHGIGVSHRYLKRLHAELARSARVLSLDLPGFGGLPKPGRDLGVEEMASALGRFLDELGLGAEPDEERATLVGHSMGAQWVVELAAQRPDLARGVVIVGPVTDSGHRSVWAQTRALAVDTLLETPRVNAVVFSDYIRCGPRWYLTQVRPMIVYPIEDRAADLTVPLLVVRGDRDPVAGLAWCRRLRDSAARGALAIVPGGAHVVQETATSGVAAVVSVFTRSGPEAIVGRGSERAS